MKVLHIAETIRGGIASYLNELHPQQQASFGADNVHYVVPSDHRRDLGAIDDNQITTFERSSRSISGLFQMLRASMQALDAFRPDESLKTFNRDVKISKADFSVRCGVNAGLVYFDDATPLETISDRVIDVAGHMQKHAEPNTVLIARKVIEPLRQLEEFTHTSQIIDGYEASVWRDPETSSR